MTISQPAVALLLAFAVVVGPGPGRARQRAGVVGRSRRDVRPPRRPGDPIATASTLDVLAVCLSAGMAVPAAAAATASAAPPALRAVLQRASRLLALGADPETAWSAEGESDPGCEALMRLARRSACSGSALAQGVAELAEQSRQEATNVAEAAAERAGVLIAGPLGLCFLPAFILLGVVPVVAGLAGEVFGGGLL
jgi:pilus assembly protein TadC